MTTQNIDPKALKATFSRRQLRQGRKRWRKRAVEPLLAQIGAMSTAGTLTGFMTGLILFVTGGMIVTLIAIWTSGYHHLVASNMQWQRLSLGLLGYALLVTTCLSIFVGWRLARNAARLLALHEFSVENVLRRSWTVRFTLLPAAFYFVLIIFLMMIALFPDLIEFFADTIDVLVDWIEPTSLEETVVILLIGALFLLATLPFAWLILRLMAWIARFQFWLCGFHQSSRTTDIRLIRLRTLLSMMAMSALLIVTALWLLWAFWDNLLHSESLLANWVGQDTIADLRRDFTRDPEIPNVFFLLFIGIGFQCILYTSLAVMVSMMALREETLGKLAEPQFSETPALRRWSGGLASAAIIALATVWYDVHYGIRNSTPLIGEYTQTNPSCDGTPTLLNLSLGKPTPDSHHLHFEVAAHAEQHSILRIVTDNDDSYRSRLNRERLQSGSRSNTLEFLLVKGRNFDGHLAVAKVIPSAANTDAPHRIELSRTCLTVAKDINTDAFLVERHLVQLDPVMVGDDLNHWRGNVDLISEKPGNEVELKTPRVFSANGALHGRTRGTLNMRSTQQKEQGWPEENYTIDQSLSSWPSERSLQQTRDRLTRQIRRDQMVFSIAETGRTTVEVVLTPQDQQYNPVEDDDKKTHPSLFALIEVVPLR